MGRAKRKTVKKAVDSSAIQKHHLKRPGFNAFGAQAPPATKRGALKLAVCTEVEPPETGIHSLAWANAIVPQSAGLLRLPFELRRRIWNHVFEDFSYGDKAIQPMKKGDRFYSPSWPDAAREATALAETCRQIYVDVVGGGLLYQAKQFSFTPGLMLNYLWVINPVHKNSIRSIHLAIKISHDNFSPPKKAFAMLAELPGLQQLSLEIMLLSGLCPLPSRFYPMSSEPLHNGRHVPSNVLTKFRICQALREIKGLQSFKMEFLTMSCDRTGQRDFYGYPVYAWNRVVLSEGTSGPYYDLEEELKQIVVAKK